MTIFATTLKWLTQFKYMIDYIGILVTIPLTHQKLQLGSHLYRNSPHCKFIIPEKKVSFLLIKLWNVTRIFLHNPILCLVLWSLDLLKELFHQNSSAFLKYNKCKSQTSVEDTHILQIQTNSVNLLKFLEAICRLTIIKSWKNK